MQTLAEFWRRLLFLFRQRQFDRDLEEEMRFHLEMKSAGMGRSAARRQFGNEALLREDSRAAWGWTMLERLTQDVRYAARGLRKNSGFTTVVVLTLALGIGVNTAIFGLVDHLLLQPLPFPQSERLANVYWQSPPSGTPYNSVSYPAYLYYRDHNRVFSGLAAYDEIEVGLRIGGETEVLPGEIVTANYFDVLGVKPLRGRSFTADEDLVPGRNPVAMISEELWQRRFGGDPAILHRPVTINGIPFAIVGVVPRGYVGLDLQRSERPSVWVPTMMYTVAIRFGGEWDFQHEWRSEWLSAAGRLKPGITFPQAETQIEQITQAMLPLWRNAKMTFREGTRTLVIPANYSRVPPDSRKKVISSLTTWMAVVGLVLLIACCNVASLLLARAVKRQREIALRLALGAGRTRLAQQLLTEASLLALIAGPAGLALGLAAERGVRSFRPFGLLIPGAALDGRAMAFAAAVSLITAVLFGIVPLRQAVRAPSSGFHGRSMSRSGRLLVVIQVAVSLILLAGAGLFARTLRNAQATDPTLEPEKVLLARLDLATRKSDSVRDRQFFDTLLERVLSLPGVRGAAYVFVVPMGGRRGGTNLAPHPGEKPIQVDFNVVSAGYFRMVGLPIVHGRAFDSRDRKGSPAVAIVNEQAARRFWPGEDPLGKQIEFHKGYTAEIIGVVRDGRFRNYRAAIQPCFYTPSPQSEFSGTNLEVRTSGDPALLYRAVRREVQALRPDVIVPEIQTLRSYRDAGLGQERLSAALLSGLGALAALIAAIGVYGILAFAVAQRTREIGVRMALGAASGAVLRAVLREALTLIGIGLAIGYAAAIPLAKLVASQLYGVSPADPLTFATTAGILLAVGAAAAYLPALRASRVDPVVALRWE